MLLKVFCHTAQPFAKRLKRNIFQSRFQKDSHRDRPELPLGVNLQKNLLELFKAIRLKGNAMANRVMRHGVPL